MRDFSKKFTKPDEMDMKKIPKPRMEEYERRQRREREKYERQQVHVVDREVSLFSEPRRVDPSEGDDHIAAKLGEFSKVKDFITQNIVGISSSGHRPQMPPNSSMMPGMMPSSSSASSVGRLPPTQHLPPPSSSSSSSSSHHYPPQQQQQQSRQPYTKQADNKPPYNGRGGYPGQPVKNDLRSSSGMAPPKGPPTMSSSSSSSSACISTSSSSSSSSYNSASMLLPPATSNMPNGRPSSADKLMGAGVNSSASGSSSFLAPLGPPTTTTHNGRFSQPPIPKMRQKPLPSENDITQILSEITQKFHAPPPLTEIAATPRTTIVENYNLNGPNKHKYSFDPIGPITPLAPLEPFPSMLTPIQPISALPAPAPAAAPTIAAPIVPVPPTRPKESAVKPLKSTDKPVAPALEKLNNSTLEHDLELSESDDERKKHVSSPVNSSESSQTDSSDSGSEEAEQQPHKQSQQQQQQHQQMLQQQRASSAAINNSSSLNKKKVSQMITASGGNTISSLLSGSAGSSASSAPSSASSSNKTPSPTDSNKWNLSRYFNKAATQQTQNDASPSGANANAGVPMMLPGGAQIIPEPTPTATLPTPTAVLTNVKNEAIADDEADVDDDDDEDIVPSRSNAAGHANISPAAAAHEAFRHPAAFSASRKPELSVTPLSPLMKHTLLDEIKKEADTLFPHPMTVKGMVPTALQQQQQQQVPLLNPAEFVAIPTSQIKHEAAASATPIGSSLIAGGTTSVTPYNKHSPVPTSLHQLGGEEKHHQQALTLRKHTKQYMTMDVLSGLSSDTNSSDVNEPVTVPMPGPGGTLQIPGVPAAITALPRSSPQLQQKPQMQPNALTVTPISRVSPPPKYKNASPAAGLSLGAVQQRAKKPRKKLKQQPQTAGLIESSDEEEGEYNSSSAASKCVSPAASAGSLKTTPVDSVALAAATTAAAAKKGRGRPRKPTPSQSGNISSASSTTTKGPTLTAKKDVAANAPSGKKPAARRKIARQNSGSNATSSTSSTPQVTPTKAQVSSASQKAGGNKQRSQVKSNEYVASSEDSSSSSSSYSKSSSSSSDSEDNSASASSIDELKRQRRLAAAGANAAVPPARRIVKQLNKRKTSLDDAPVTVALAAVVTGAAASTGGAKMMRKDTTSSSCSSDESSSEEYVARSAAAAAAAANDLAAAAGATTPHGVGHRQQNQSPLKTASSRSRVSSTSSSSSTGSTSSSSSSSGDDDRSDNEAMARKENKKLRRDKPKSDKNKINTLSRIFNPKEGGAKKQGQVVIIDQSDELLAKEQHQHQHQQQQQLQQQQLQKHFSPNAAFKSSVTSSSQQQQHQQQDSSSSMTTSANSSSTPTQANTNSHSHSSLVQTVSSVAPSLTSTAASMSTTTIASAQSPRLTPSNALHMKSSPRHPLVAVQQQQQQYITNKRTPDRSSSSAERKLQQRIKTPTRVHTPSRTPTPTKHLNAAFPSLICKIELSRLRRIPPQPPNILASPRGSAAGHLTPVGGAGRTPIYDHETILHADLQATQMRLKPPASGSGRHTPNTFAAAENAKSRLEELSSNGRLSSRSPKEPVPPNGYTMRVGAASPASTKLLTGVKHEQLIKYEPDIDTTTAASYCADTKFKSGSSLVKQELLIVKQDYKPTTASTTPTDKQLLAAQDSPSFGAMDIGGAKPRRKRSSSSSSSPYKEKKRKKDKDKEERTKDKEAAAAAPVTTKEKEKDKAEREREKEREKLQNQRFVGSGGAVDVGGVGAGATLNHMQPNTQLQMQQQQQQQQLPPTNHDRLVMEGSKQQQALDTSTNTTTATTMSTTRDASPATHLQNVASHMPPPATTTPSDKLLSSPMMLGTASAQHPLANVSSPSPPMPAPQPQVIYRSYFERDEDALSDDFSKNTKFLQEAVNRKHAADREQNTFNQVTLYLEAVVYFLLSGAAMEAHRSSEDAAWTMYKDTLALIKFISSIQKFKHLQSSSSTSNGQHETHNKVAILSLRCQSLISLKLYKMKRHFCRTVMNSCSDYFKGKTDIINGNTPSSISPSNSLCSQGSGSNTPPGKIVPQEVHTALCQQNQFFNYLTSSHDLWDQADSMVRKGNHTEFFIALDHENGPLTLHSSMYEVFKYVQAGLKKLKDEMSIQ